MTRTKIRKRTRQQRQDEDWKDMVRFTELQIELTTHKMDLMEKQYKDLVDAYMAAIFSHTSKKLLSTKMSELWSLKLKRLVDYKSPPQLSKTRNGQRRKEKELPQSSSDRANVKEFSATPISLLRWPNSNERVVSIKGSPLAVQCLPFVNVNAHIPTKTGVIELKPIQMDEVEPEIVEQLDGDTLNEIKTLLENLSSIISAINGK